MKLANKIKSDFFKNASVLIGGTLLAQLLPVILQPFLRRVFSPEEFGLAAVYFSIVAILSVVASMNYHSTIVLPNEDEDANSLVMGSILISFFFSILIFIVIILFSNPIISFFNFPIELKSWVILIPLSVFFNSCHLILGNWLTRKKAFKKFALNKISRRVAEGISHVIFGLIKIPKGLILGTFIGDFTNLITYLLQFKKTGGRLKMEISKIKFNLKRYIHFPKYSLLPNLLSSISLFIPIIIINSLYDTKITGQFDLSRQILAVPLTLISLSISQVFLQKISESRTNKSSFFKLYKNLLLLLSSLSVLAIVLAYFFSVDLFVFLFGAKWKYAGLITELLILSYAIKFVVSPLAISFIALEELKLNSLWQISYFVGIISLFFFKDINFDTFVKIYITIDIIFYLCYGFLTFYIIKKYEKSLNKPNF